MVVKMKISMRYLLMLFLCFNLGAVARSFPDQDSIDMQLGKLSGEAKIEFLIQAAKKSSQKKPDKAVRYALIAWKMAKSSGKRESQAKVSLLLSDGYINLGKTDSALYFANQAVALYRSLNNSEGIIKSSNQLGVVLLNKGTHVEAEKVLMQTFKECNALIAEEQEDENLEELIAEVFNNLMVAFIQQGNYKKAKEKLLQYSKNTNFGNTYAGMVLAGNLSTVYQMLGQNDSALFFADHALAIAKLLNEPRNIGKGYTDIGNIYYVMGRYGDAVESFNKGVEILLPLNDKQRLAKLYNNLAAAYKQIAYYEKATAFFLQSLTLKLELQDSMGIAATYNNIGLVYKDLENYKMAETYLKLAVALNQKLNNRKQLSTNYTGLGDLYLGLEQADTSLYYFHNSLDLKREIGHKYGMIIVLHGIGNVYTSLKHDDKIARDYFEQALRLANQTGSDYEIANLNISLGELSYKAQRLVEANELFNQSFVYARRENALDLMHTAARYLTEINVQMGKKAAAMEYFMTYRTIGDTLFNRDKTRAIMEMQARFETEKKDRENMMLQKEITLQKRQIILLIIFSIILLFLGLVIYYFYFQKVRASRKIVQKNLELVKAEKRMEARRELQAEIQVAASVQQPYEDIANTTLGLLVKLTRLMAEEKPYLESGITIEDICRRIGTNRTYLSQLINENFNQNFSCYINEFRIKEARRLLAERKNDNISIEGIGMMSGFNSKMTFHTQFKQQVGVTPSYFRKSVNQISHNT